MTGTITSDGEHVEEPECTIITGKSQLVQLLLGKCWTTDPVISFLEVYSTDMRT